MSIPLSGPDITRKEIAYVNSVLTKSGGILSIGPWLEKFEDAFRTFTGRKYAVAVNSGTSALFLLANAVGWQDGDRIVTSPYSFIASANTPLFVRAVPKFVDIDLKTYNMDIEKAGRAALSEDVKGIIAVDVFGHPLNISAIKRKLKGKPITIIEDSCEALGSEFNGRKCGTLALAGTYAFYPNKQITTGEGGIIVTDNKKIYEYCISARSQGRAITGLWLEHERLGYNFRMSELNAALGVAQMERLDEILEKRNRAAGRYYELLRGTRGITLPHISPDVNFMSWFVFVVRISKYDNEFAEFKEYDIIPNNKRNKFGKLLRKTNNLRSSLLNELLNKGIGCKPYFTPIHLQKFYKRMFGYKIGDFPVTEYVGSGTLAIPFFTNITLKQQKQVAKIIRDFFN